MKLSVFKWNISINGLNRTKCESEFQWKLACANQFNDTHIKSIKRDVLKPHNNTKSISFTM